MNKITILFILLVFSLGSIVIAQEDQWIYDDMFIDFWDEYGVSPADAGGIHGVTIAPDGNVWLNLYGAIAEDTIFLGTEKGDTLYTRPLWILDAETKEHASFSPLAIIDLPGGVKDTIHAASDLSGSGRGIASSIDGNILSTHYATLYKINYQTGAGMAMWASTGSCTDASQADDGKIFIGRVGKNLPIYILDQDLNQIGTAVDTAAILSRSIEVTADGKDIYRGTIWPAIGIQHYHSDLPGVLKYTLVDTIDGDTVKFGTPAWASCLDWDPDGYLLAGFIKDAFMASDTLNPAGSRWYAYDVDTEGYPIKYTIGAVQTESDPDLMVQGDAGGFMSPRGMAFDSDGKMYLADFDFNMVSTWIKNPASIEVDGEVIARTYDLSQNYPNPFNPVTTIPFAIYKNAHVELKVYDVQGKLVDTLVDGPMNAGNHNIKYDANHLATGNYFYQLKVEGHMLTKKMILVR